MFRLLSGRLLYTTGEMKTKQADVKMMSQAGVLFTHFDFRW